jgi:hypothetical protein
VSGVSTLFSAEFYGNVKRYMAPNGLLVQWVQAYEINVGLLSSIFLALGSQFEDYAVFAGGKSGDLFIVATPKGRLPEMKADVFAQARVAADLQHLGFRSWETCRRCAWPGARPLEPLFASAGFPANSDYFPVIDQRAPRSRFKNESAEDLRRLREAPAPVLALLDGESRTPLAPPAAPRRRPARTPGPGRSRRAVDRRLSQRRRRPGERPHHPSRSAWRSSRGAFRKTARAPPPAGSRRSPPRAAATPVLAREDVAVLFDKAQASRCARTLDEAGGTGCGSCAPSTIATRCHGAGRHAASGGTRPGPGGSAAILLGRRWQATSPRPAR